MGRVGQQLDGGDLRVPDLLRTNQGSVEKVEHEDSGSGSVEGMGRSAEDGGAVAMDSPIKRSGEVEEVEGATQPPHRQAREIGPLLDVEQIRRLVDGWKDICATCKILGRASKGHVHWKECGSGAVDKATVEGALTRLESVKFESFSGCDYCRRPQAVCEFWARSTNTY
jgi:hypothetical protein